LVLASVEPFFDPESDSLFTFDLTDGEVTVAKNDWRPLGDASAWLTSHVFDLETARSVPAEKAIRLAKEALLDPLTTVDEVRHIHNELRGVLKDTDPFWPRWVAMAERLGVEP